MFGLENLTRTRMPVLALAGSGTIDLSSEHFKRVRETENRVSHDSSN